VLGSLGVLWLLAAVVAALVAYYLGAAWAAAHPVVVPVESDVPQPAPWLLLVALAHFLLLLLLPVASVASFVVAVADETRRDRPGRRLRLATLGLLLTALNVTAWWGAVRPDYGSGPSGYGWRDVAVAGLLLTFLAGVLAVARTPRATQVDVVGGG
jgi:hypothetical protein